MTSFPQAPNTVVMIRSHHFFPNGMTAADNTFQRAISSDDKKTVWQQAYDEVTLATETLTRHGVNVLLFEDETTQTPDSVFPNNWFSTHPDGRLVLYPMYAENRRKERRSDIVDVLKERFNISEVVDYAPFEKVGEFLEGTGAMVLDHIGMIAYMAASNRANPKIFHKWCEEFGFIPMVFEAADRNGVAVYHTNVIMCIATDFALVGLDMITDELMREEVIRSLSDTGRTIIPLTSDQIEQFAGNALELQGSSGKILALSNTAKKALTPDQIEIIERNTTLVPINVPTIECAGGSVRCMLAGIHLPAKIATGRLNIS